MPEESRPNHARTDYCSWCFERTRHEPRDRTIPRRRIYECMGCGRPTLVCRAPKCTAMARDEGRFPDLFCAAHAGMITGFSQLTRKIPSIDDYEILFQREVKNLSPALKIGVAGVGGAILLAPAAFIAAPAIGGVIGTEIFGLSGAAAVSKGLATLGFGSLATGGFGMAGGIAVISATGAIAGTALAGVLADAYFSEVDGFKIVRLKEGRGPAVIVINGFLTQDGRHPERDWLNALGKKYARNPWYLLEWESKRLGQAGAQLADLATTKGLLTATKMFAGKATRSASKVLFPVDLALSVFKLGRNPWTVATVKAAMTGALLAEILSRTPGSRKYVLVGHSLGARVIYYALQSLGGAPIQRVKAAHLLGGAVGTGKRADWNHAATAVYGGINNYYSKNDDILRLAYTAGRAFMGAPAIGRNPISATAPNIFNHDVTAMVDAHNEYKRAAAEFLVT